MRKLITFDNGSTAVINGHLEISSNSAKIEEEVDLTPLTNKEFLEIKGNHARISKYRLKLTKKS